MTRMLFLFHRYLGMLIGLVLILWSLSGIVMMYKPFPALSALDQLALLNKLNFDHCCNLETIKIINLKYRSARLEMLGDRSFLRLKTESDELLNYDLTSGTFTNSISPTKADSLAQQFAERSIAVPNSGHKKPIEPSTPLHELLKPDGLQAVFQEKLHHDQWTMEAIYHKHRPLFKYRIENINGPNPGVEFYLSSLSGEIVQLTSSEQRVWAYFGSIIHWVYPTILRQNVALWSQLVIWVSIAAISLVIVGVYVGLHQFKKRNNGRLSPYRGAALIHHYAGLIFGALALLWLISGVLSMNPWGALESNGVQFERGEMQNKMFTIAEIEPILQSLKHHQFDETIVRLNFRKQIGKVALMADQKNGRQQRININDLNPSKLSAVELANIAATLPSSPLITSQQLINEPDNYYYQHHQPIELPVYRVVVNDKENHRYYISPISGEVLATIDANAKWYRWFVYGIHRADFTVMLRSRPLWDFVMLFFLTGVIVLFVTGGIVAVKRAKRIITLR